MKEERKYPTPFQHGACWAALTGLSLLVIVGIVAGLLYGFSAAFVALEPVLLPVVIAAVLAYLLMPCVHFVQNKLKVKKRVLAVLIVMLTASLTLAALGSAIVPPLYKQTNELIAQRKKILHSAVSTIQEYLQESKPTQYVVDSLYEKAMREAELNTHMQDAQWLETANDYPAKVAALLNFYSGTLTATGWQWLTAGTRAIYGAAGVLIGVVMIPVFLFYFLLLSEIIAEKWHNVLPLRDSKFRIEVVETLQQINDYIVSFLRGQMLVSIIDGVILGIALKMIGLPYAITIAAAAGLLGIIPYIGMISTSIPALLLAWFTWHDLGHVLGVAAIFFGVSQFEGWVLQPKVVGDRVNMHDLTIMFSVLFWSHVLGGVVGALLAVPLTASIKVIFMRYVWPTHSKEEL